MLILFPPRACFGAAKPDKKAKCLLCICFLSNFRAKARTHALLSERRDCVFLFLRLQKYISTHKQRPAETKVIPISLSCRLLPFAGEMFSRSNLKNAGNFFFFFFSTAAPQLAVQPKLRPKPAKTPFGIRVMIAGSEWECRGCRPARGRAANVSPGF